LLGAFAITYLRLFLQGLRCLTRTLAGTGIGTRTLTTHWQAATMAKATVATDVHQTLDVHRRFATQITFDGEQSDLVTDLFEIAISQIFDLFSVIDLTSFANFASTGATDAKNRSQADFGVLLWRNVDTCYTSHMRPLILFEISLDAVCGVGLCK
jgi:hypothetical protein